MLKNRLIILFKAALFILIFYLLSFGNINGVIYPFCFGMMFALVWSNQKVYLVMPAYLIGTMAASFNVNTLICSLCTILVLLVPYLIHIKCKKVIKVWEMGVYAILSQTAFVTLEVLYGNSAVYAAITIILGTLFMYSAMGIFEAVIIRGTNVKLTNLEILYGGVIVLAVASSLMHFNIGTFSFLKLFAAILILVLGYTTSPTMTLLLSSVIGLGTIISTNNAVFFAPLVLWALGSCMFKIKCKYIPAAALLLIEAAIGWYFKLYYSFGIIEYLPCIISAVLFVCVPQRWYDKISSVFSASKDRLAVKNVVNRNRDILYKRLSELSEVFGEMDRAFRSMLKKSLSEDEVRLMLYDEVKESICEGCPEKNKCHRAFSAESQKVFTELISTALDRGRITLLDVPAFLSSRCSRLNPLISSINTLSTQYKKYATLVGNIDNSKILVADNLSGIANIMKDLANEVKVTISFDTVRENKIIDELTYNNISCLDAIVYEKDTKTACATLVVREEDAKRYKLTEVVGDICNCNMTITDINHFNKLGYVNVNFVTAPRYDCIFGTANRTKTTSKASGDCFTAMKLEGDKFLLAVCDGMGSGEKAEESSEVAIGLIENFYKAGFDSDLILSSVNRLLGLSREEIFSALDIAVVDLKSGAVDFIKMGAPSAYVKNDEGAKIVESGALPIGIINDAKPVYKKEILREGEAIILCSDGISDSFANDEELCDYIASINSSNPQNIADEILKRAIDNNNGTAMDDMTVLCMRLFEKT